MAWVTVIAGPRASGKTTITRAMVEHFSKTDWPILVVEEYKDGEGYVITNPKDPEKMNMWFLRANKKSINLDRLRERDGIVIITALQLTPELENAARSIFRTNRNDLASKEWS